MKVCHSAAARLGHRRRPRRLGTVTWISGMRARSWAVMGGVPVTIGRSSLGSGARVEVISMAAWPSLLSGGLSIIGGLYHFGKRALGRFHATRIAHVRTSPMSWYWFDVGPDGGRAVCEELGLFLVVVLQDGGSVGFWRLGDSLLRMTDERQCLN
jgi:hypothetical protein